MANRGQARMTDTAVGECSHGAPCCPHLVTTFYGTQMSPDDFSDNLATIRLDDVHMKVGCPHCCVSMAISSSARKFINNMGAHRLDDFNSEFAGMSVGISGSGRTTVG